MFKLISILLFSSLCLLNGQTFSNNEINEWTKRAQNVNIIRDNYGVPHIYGKTDADVVFGLMYTQCEDDFNRVEENYLDALGRLSESLGENYFYQDARARMYADTLLAKNNYLGSPIWLKALLDGFASGINYYLHKNPNVKPKIIQRFEPWMPLLFTEGSIGGNITIIPVQGVKDFYEGNGMGYHVPEIPEWEQEPAGSNGFAIAPELTKNGHPLLLINPHTSFYFRTEVHLVSEEGLNTYGAVTWGQFFVYQGFNDKCGWMHTSSAADVADEYLETIEKRGKDYFYLYENKWLPVKTRKEIISFHTTMGIKKREITLYFTHHGPVIARKDGKWVSIRMMTEQIDALAQSFLRTKTADVKSFEKVMKLNTNSSNNTVFADNSGNIAYWHGNFMPKRSLDYNWNGLLDGTTSNTEWKGFHTVKELVRIINPANGWIQNCNSDPFTASGKYSPERKKYPDYMAPDEENFRGVAALRILENVKGQWTLDSLIKAAFNPFLPGLSKIIPDLLKVYKGDLSNPFLDPLKELSVWNFERDSLSVATTLAVFYGENIMEIARIKSGYGAKSMLNLETYVLNNLSETDKKAAFEKAINQLNSQFGTWNITWGEINRFQRISAGIRAEFNDDLESLPVGFTSSAWGSLAAFGSKTQAGTKKRYGTLGNSFVAVVEFGPKINAHSIVTGGSSSDLNSPHFNDQSLRYTRGQFKKVHFYKNEVETNAVKTYHP
jgi:acyl-homoserine lactone acylase PvdQ